MKLVHFISGFVLLLLLAGCSNQKELVVAPLRFHWKAPQHFQVVETIQKKRTEIQIVHDCELVQTNKEFELRWLDAKIVEFNGEKVANSEELKRAIAPLEPSFVYPSFRISQSGQFVEVINSEESVKRTDQMLDVVATNRSEDSRKFFANFAKTETGKQVLNGVFGQIWQTWVGAWAGIALDDGGSQSANGTVAFSGTEVPAFEKITNLGSIKSAPDIVSLKYEQNLSSTNFTPELNKLIEKIASETEIKSAGAITNKCSIRQQTILEVHAERQTLRPHWAKRTMKTTIIVPGEPTETELEVHEYRFQWDSTTPAN